jgi:hypothetical protein
MTTITNNQGTVLQELRNIANNIESFVDLKIKDFETRIQGHLNPVAKLVSSDS